MTTLIVVADQADTDAVARKKPVFEIEGQEYFHGDIFVPLPGFTLNMDNFQGRGMRFTWIRSHYNEEGKLVQTSVSMILPVAEGAAENIEEPLPAQVQRVKKPKTPKAV